MIYKLFVFRHSETKDNSNEVFSGWRDSKLTPNGLLQAHKIAEQLKLSKIDFSFTSHLQRARKTLEIVLQYHQSSITFVDDRLIERCYGLLQGKSKRKVEASNPLNYHQIHRSYDFVPSEGESLKMADIRVHSFLEQLRSWLTLNPGNIAISCHSNSIRSIRRIFECLTLQQMLQLESPQDCAMIYEIDAPCSTAKAIRENVNRLQWKTFLIPQNVKIATDPRNPLRVFYS